MTSNRVGDPPLITIVGKNPPIMVFLGSHIVELIFVEVVAVDDVHAEILSAPFVKSHLRRLGGTLSVQKWNHSTPTFKYGTLSVNGPDQFEIPSLNPCSHTTTTRCQITVFGIPLDMTNCRWAQVTDATFVRIIDGSSPFGNIDCLPRSLKRELDCNHDATVLQTL